MKQKNKAQQGFTLVKTIISLVFIALVLSGLHIWITKKSSDTSQESQEQEEQNEEYGEFSSYNIIKKGEGCNEFLGVEYGDLEVSREEWSSEWSAESIMSAVVFKRENGEYKKLFSLDQSNMKDEEGKVFTAQVKAEYGYGFKFEESSKGWYFNFMILDEQGKFASEEAMLFWSNSKCDYDFIIAGQNIRL